MKWLDDARAAARARRKANSPVICDEYIPSVVKYIVRGGRMQGYLCANCAAPPKVHPRAPAPLVPASTRIRTRSIRQVETERLERRLAWLRENLAMTSHDQCEQKNDFRAFARETINIERELSRRSVDFEPVTDGHHLAIDVFAVREIRPSR